MAQSRTRSGILVKTVGQWNAALLSRVRQIPSHGRRARRSRCASLGSLAAGAEETGACAGEEEEAASAYGDAELAAAGPPACCHCASLASSAAGAGGTAACGGAEEEAASAYEDAGLAAAEPPTSPGRQDRRTPSHGQRAPRGRSHCASLGSLAEEEGETEACGALGAVAGSAYGDAELAAAEPPTCPGRRDHRNTPSRREKSPLPYDYDSGVSHC